MRKSLHRIAWIVGGTACTGLLLAAGGMAPRQAQAMSAPTASPAQQKTTTPTVVLHKLGAIHLAGVDQEEVLTSHFSTFGMDDRGRFGFLKGCGCERTFVLVDSEGKLARKIVLPKPLDEKQTERKAIWIRGDQWLIVASNDENGGKSTAQWVDTATGEVTDLAGFSAPPVKALAATHDGGFVALVNTAPASKNDGETLALMAFDRIGRKLWTVRQSGNSVAMLPLAFENRTPSNSHESGGSPMTAGILQSTRLVGAQGVAVTRAGQIVVYDGMLQRLEVYGRDGAFHRQMVLKQTDSPESYTSRVDDDGTGGVIVSSEDGPAYRAGIDRALPAETWKPVTKDGRSISMKGGVIAAPDGNLWTSDGYSFLRLDSHGVADRVVGAAFDPAHLGSIAELTATHAGRIYAVDERTHAVHVFDGDGKHLQVDRPAPGDTFGNPFGSSMVATDAGDVYLPRPVEGTPASDGSMVTSFVHFTPAGRRAGVESSSLPGEFLHEWAAQPGSANRWALGVRALYRIDAQGKVIGKIDKDENGQAFHPMRILGSAPDGSLLATAVPQSYFDRGFRGERKLQFDLVRVSASGQVIGHAVSASDYGFGKSGFDGTRLAVAKEQEDGKGKVILVMDPGGKPLYQAQLPPDYDVSGMFLENREGTAELWTFDGKSTIDRYRLQ